MIGRPVPGEPSLAEIIGELRALRREVADLREAVLGRDSISEPAPASVIEPDPIDRLRADCARLGLPVTQDDFVNEADAARLLNRAPGTLKNWRAQHRPLSFRTYLGRVQYALLDLAEFIAGHTMSSDEIDF